MGKLSKGIVLSSILLTGCSKDMNYIIEHEPNIAGTVIETSEDRILIENEEGEYSVSLDVENGDSMTHFKPGDEVKVYFDGVVAESWPMQINHVYAITYTGPVKDN